MPKERHRVTNYRPEWESDPKLKGWITASAQSKKKAFCKACNIHLTTEISTLRRHGLSNNHITQMSILKTTKPLTKVLDRRPTPHEGMVKTAEITVSAVFAESNIPFRIVDNLVPALKKIFPDSKIAQDMQLGRTKLTNVIRNVIGKSERQIVAEKLKKTPFSILIDESTDVSTSKVMGILVRYFDEETFDIQSSLWCIAEIYFHDGISSVTVSIAENGAEEIELNQVPVLRGGNAEDLFKLVKKSFSDFNIPDVNTIGYASDGANVMLGEHNSVASRFRQNYPGIYVLKCICHSLHLCASKAASELPRNCEELARSIYSYFNHSAKRRSEFQQFQEFLELPIHRMLHPSQTRWLSLEAVVQRLLEQWNALEAYFQQKSSGDERPFATEQILKLLRDPLVQLHFAFLSWVLPKFTQTNKYFQSSQSVLPEVHERMKILMTELLMAYMDNRWVSRYSYDFNNFDVENEGKFVRDSEMYLGIRVVNAMENDHIRNNRELCKYFYASARKFLIRAVKEIKDRYDFNDEVLETVSSFHPQKAVSFDERKQLPSLMTFLNKVPRLKLFFHGSKAQILDDEWRRLPSIKLPEDFPKTTTAFWVELLKLRNVTEQPVFDELPRFVLYVLSLPHSNADCERIFSKMNLVKTKSRNKLLTENVCGVMLSSQLVKRNGGSAGFTVTKDMLSRMNTKNLYCKADVEDVAIGLDDVFV